LDLSDSAAILYPYDGFKTSLNHVNPVSNIQEYGRQAVIAKKNQYKERISGMSEIARVIALGASNLTRGFHAVVSSARAMWGPEVQIFAAFGHGRSYGASSRVLFRTLPGILESGLWRTLASFPRVPTRALVTDVGNDILYGYSTGQILKWVDETVRRLQEMTHDIILTDLPLESVRRLSRAKYLVARSILFPSSRLPLSEALETAARLNEGLAELSASRGVKFFRLNSDWYGVDPIHIRPSLWRSAWQEILDVPPQAAASSTVVEGLKLYFMAPERKRLFGAERYTPQTGTALKSGGCVWLY
jgi:hypothetical protein